MTTPLDRLTEALADRYRIDKEIGAGGMATVYLAHDVRHDRQVALKVLRPELSAILGAERFLAEIRTTANLQHPHILPLHDSGEAAGLVFYVMPFVEGESLRDRLKREQQLPIADAVKLAREIAGALDYAHRHGVVHRDIKPENILLHDGQALVADFGIALAVSRTDGSTRMTETGLSLGTPHYMSPEQAMGERTVDARTDVYALGCVLYEMLAGEPPFTGPSAQAIVAKVMASDPDAITTLRRSVPPHVTAVVHTAIQKLPADRFPTAAAFAEALGNTSFATTLSLPGVAGSAAPGLRSNRPALTLGAVAVAAIGMALWGWLRPGPVPEVSRYSVLLPEDQALGNSQQSRVAISPDGKVLVYASEGGSNPQLMARPRDALVASALGGTGGAINPSFSPDGKRVAFVQGSPRALRVSSLAGGAPVTVTDSLVDQGGVSWGYDGYIYYDGHLEGDGVARVRETGGDPEQVTMPDSSTETWHFQPEALPNGRGVLFTIAVGNGGWKIGASLVGSLRHTVLAEGRAPKYMLGFLFYVTSDGNLMAAPFDQEKLAFTGDATPVAQELAIRGLGRVDLTFSQSGTMVYTRGTQSEGKAELVWVTRNGTVTSVDTSWTQVMDDPALSPDGRRVALTVREAGQLDVWIKELDRGPATKISFGAPLNYAPAWTPDGQSILFSTFGGLETGGALMLGPADGARLPATYRTGIVSRRQTRYTADGQWVVFGRNGDIQAIRTMGDTGVVGLIHQPSVEIYGSVSPDGRWLAYMSDETGQYQVYVTPFPDTKVAKRVVSVDGGLFPQWARNGRELFYVTPGGTVIAAQVLSGAAFAVGERKVLFEAGSLRLRSYSGLEPSPDGNRFLMLRQAGIGERPDELIVVENFLTEVRAKVKQ